MMALVRESGLVFIVQVQWRNEEWMRQGGRLSTLPLVGLQIPIRDYAIAVIESFFWKTSTLPVEDSVTRKSYYFHRDDGLCG